MDLIRRNNRLGRWLNVLRLFRVLAASILDRLCMPSSKCEMQLNASRISANAARIKFQALASSRLIDVHANNYFQSILSTTRVEIDLASATKNEEANKYRDIAIDIKRLQ